VLFRSTLSDYWQNRKVLASIGYGLSALSKPLFALVTTPTAALGVYFCDRLGKGIRVAPRDALIADTTPADQLGAAYGLRQSLDTIGAYLGPLAAIGLMALTAQNFRLVFELTLIPGVLAVGLLLLGIREPAVVSATKVRSNPFDRQALGQLSQAYWLLLAVALIASLGNSSNAFLLLRASEVGITPTWVPLTLVVMNITYFLSAYPAGILSDRLGRNGVLLSGFLLYILVYTGFAFAQAPWHMWVLFGFYGVHLGMNKGILAALVADTAPVTLRGTAFGLFNFVVGLSLLLANFLAGGIWQWRGSQAMFLVEGVFTAIAVLLLLVQSNWQASPTVSPEADQS